jgi:hypothetical protein
VKWAILPAALRVIGVIPFVVRPVANSYDDILITILLPIDITPHVRAGAAFALVNFGSGIDLVESAELVGAKVDIFLVLAQDTCFTFDVADLNIVTGFCDVDAWFENRHFD